MSIINITADNFKETINNNKTVLLDFYADWCGPCQMVAPILKEIAEENGDITIGKINVDNEPVLAEKFGVMSIPMLIVIKDGQLTDHCVGFRQKQDILDMLK